MATTEADKERSATINAVVKTLKFSSPVPYRGAAVRLPAIGSNVNVITSSTSAVAVNQIFDHNEDPI